MCKTVAMFLAVCLVASTSAFAVMKDSADFTGFKYEGDSVLTQASTPWDLFQSNKLVEGAYTSTNGSVLHLNTMGGGSIAYVMPGECGGDYVPAANRHYPTYPDALAVNNPWKANPAVVSYPAPDYVAIPAAGYTMEIRLQVLNSQAAYGVFALGLYAGEGGDASLWDIQFMKDKIMTSSGTVFYNGNLSDAMHTVRIVRSGGGLAHNPVMDLYLDGSKIYTATKDAGGFFYGCAWNQNWLFMGAMAGGALFDANIDYLRTDFTGAYAPVPEPATLTLCVIGAAASLLRRKK